MIPARSLSEPPVERRPPRPPGGAAGPSTAPHLLARTKRKVRTQPSRVPRLLVSFAAVWDSDDVDHAALVVDGIDNPMVADTNAPKCALAFELLHAVGSRLMS